jgi:hypothetical protein
MRWPTYPNNIVLHRTLIEWPKSGRTLVTERMVNMETNNLFTGSKAPLDGREK